MKSADSSSAEHLNAPIDLVMAAGRLMTGHNRTKAILPNKRCGGSCRRVRPLPTAIFRLGCRSAATAG